MTSAGTAPPRTGWQRPTLLVVDDADLRTGLISALVGLPAVG